MPGHDAGLALGELLGARLRAHPAGEGHATRVSVCDGLQVATSLYSVSGLLVRGWSCKHLRTGLTNGCSFAPLRFVLPGESNPAPSPVDGTMSTDVCDGEGCFSALIARALPGALCPRCAGRLG